MTPAPEVAELSSDGAWSWFNDPLAIYQNAGGTATIQVPPDVPNQTDANLVLSLTGD